MKIALFQKEISIPTLRKAEGNSKGEGGLKESVKLKWNFQMSGEGHTGEPSVEGG